MKNWIPIPGTKKEKIIGVALEAFSKHGYKGVHIAELAKAAEVTTGAIYHHFGSKQNLYEVVKAEIEQRILDRMEGAASLFEDPDRKLEAAFIVGLEFAIKNEVSVLMSEEINHNKVTKLEEFFASINDNDIAGLDRLVLALWRSVLKEINEEQITPEQGKRLIKWVFKGKRPELS
ncbi:TetR/AcrR family transcriptional regulator [Oceanobacillus piezotolerans]|uniref:TetR/AcrR family transcriptional regulator n=1 Tax=Oceanobacillus piezotolerans TaxID=2448030 RepID=A0A498D5E5_9BACI|nr:TetR/AcrR family transcriptional regulator [Oceanobacillus piezotolerans]RLL44899.1 TetR/AcrR family transcriptional regulator [Oceanobacillus piezotolerans]